MPETTEQAILKYFNDFSHELTFIKTSQARVEEKLLHIGDVLSRFETKIEEDDKRIRKIENEHSRVKGGLYIMSIIGVGLGAVIMEYLRTLITKIHA